MTGYANKKGASKAMVIAAFAAVYIIWGSTYLGIKYAIRTIPPFFLVSMRFLISGSVLFAWCMVKGEKLPPLKTFAIAGFSGVLMLVLGNGAVTWAEQYLPSGLTAIVVATVPLWFVVLDKRQWHYHFTNITIVAGVVIGLAGVVMLFMFKGSVGFKGTRMEYISLLVLLLGTMGWAIGSLISKYKHVEASVTMKVAIQMSTTGIVALLISMLSNERSAFAFDGITAESAMALAYLIIFGSLIGYMSYIWLLTVRPPSLVATYAYVNPVVALFLGWLFVDEKLTLTQAGALGVILLGVILVNLRPTGDTMKEPVQEVASGEKTINSLEEV